MTESLLPDGEHDAFVIDVHDAADGGRRTQRLELTVIAGEAKGSVVAVLVDSPLGDQMDLIGMPATITVRGGEPSVTVDR